MKTNALILLAITILTTSLSVHAVPPARESQFGNPEEPALRIVKWPWLGFKKLMVRTHEGLERGIQHHPPAALCKGARGASCGSLVLMDHTARGMVYSALPPTAPLRIKVTYEDQALSYIKERVGDEETLLDEESAAETKTDTAEDALEADEEITYLPLKIKETDVEKAQRRYVPDRVAHRDRVRDGAGNLLRLAH